MDTHTESGVQGVARPSGHRRTDAAIAEQSLANTVRRAVREAMTDVVEPEYLDTRQAAGYLGLSRQRLEIWRSRGGGPPYIKTSKGGVVRYKRSDLDEFMLARRVRSTSEVPGE